MSYQSQGFKAPYIQVSCDSDQWFLSYKMIFKKVPNIETVFWPTVPLTTPYLGPCSILVLDNCYIHHTEEIWQLVEDEAGSLLLIF